MRRAAAHASTRRKATRKGARSSQRRPARGSHRLGLIGRDLAPFAPRISARRVLPVLLAVLLVALGVAALRIDLLRVRYALGDATLLENQLLEEERNLTARRRQLRDPVHLAREAAKRGFVRPENLIDLPPATARADTTVLAATNGAPTRGADRP